MSLEGTQNIIIEQSDTPTGESAGSDLMTKRIRITLPQAIRDNVDQLGHTGSHTLGVFVQLLTTGKVKLGFRNYTRRLELVDKSHLIPRVQALPLVETCLAELRGDDGAQELPEFTQNIIIQAPRPRSD